jgi:hypothetical protein
MVSNLIIGNPGTDWIEGEDNFILETICIKSSANFVSILIPQILHSINFYRINKMTKKYQSKEQRLRNKEYIDFLKAVREKDTVGIRKGLFENKFRISNEFFIDLLAKDINVLLSGNVFKTIDLDTIKYTDPENVNEKIYGRTLLDIVVDLFLRAYELADKENLNNLKEYFLRCLEILVTRINANGGVLTQIPELINVGLVNQHVELYRKIIDQLIENNPTLLEEILSDNEENMEN